MFPEFTENTEFPEITVSCTGAQCHAETTAPLVAGLDTPVHISLNPAFDSLTERYLLVKCSEDVSNYDISEKLDFTIPGYVLIGGSRCKIGVFAQSADGKRSIPTVWANCGYVYRSTTH